MPTAIKHFDHYRRNRSVLDRIRGLENPPYDWVVTIAFYTALHLIEHRIVSITGSGSDNHGDMTRCVDRLAELKPIQRYYDSLKTNGWKARYKCVPFQKNQTDALISHLEEIERCLVK